MFVKFDNILCVDPLSVKESFERIGLDGDSFWMKANSITYSINGLDDVGYFLLSAANAETILGDGSNARWEGHTVTFKDDEHNRVLVLNNIHVISCVQLTAKTFGGDHIVLLTVTTNKHRFLQRIINRNYNLSRPTDFARPEGEDNNPEYAYYADTTNTNGPYTWAELVDNLASLIELTVAPTSSPVFPLLPPEDYSFANCGAWDALVALAKDTLNVVYVNHQGHLFFQGNVGTWDFYRSNLGDPEYHLHPKRTLLHNYRGINVHFIDARALYERGESDAGIGAGELYRLEVGMQREAIPNKSVSPSQLDLQYSRLLVRYEQDGTRRNDSLVGLIGVHLATQLQKFYWANSQAIYPGIPSEIKLGPDIHAVTIRDYGYGLQTVVETRTEHEVFFSQSIKHYPEFNPMRELWRGEADVDWDNYGDVHIGSVEVLPTEEIKHQGLAMRRFDGSQDGTLQGERMKLIQFGRHFTPPDNPHLVVKPDADIESGEIGSCTVYQLGEEGANGVSTVSTVTINVLNVHTAKVTPEDNLVVAWHRAGIHVGWLAGVKVPALMEAQMYGGSNLKSTDATGQATFVRFRSDDEAGCNQGLTAPGAPFTFYNTWKLDAMCDSLILLQRVYRCDPENNAEVSGEPFWEIIHAQRRKARLVRFTGDGGSGGTVTGYYRGEDPTPCGFLITAPLGTACTSESEMFAEYDTNTDRYIPISSKSGLLGDPTEGQVIRGMSNDGCSMNYVSQVVKLFPCDNEPTMGSTTPTMFFVNVLTSLGIITEESACTSGCEFVWLELEGIPQWRVYKNYCDPDCQCADPSGIPDPAPGSPFGTTTTTVPCTRNDPPAVGLAANCITIATCYYAPCSSSTTVIPINYCPDPPPE